ncbi:hypothetical protein CSQ96_01660 [Janthinobacterium sp. BJB412]|nr:hypothetical protein CSQ96_01660 [Janthinobacterium sp. BJB412]
MKLGCLITGTRQAAGLLVLASFLLVPIGARSADSTGTAVADAASSADVVANSDILGKWRLTKVLDSADIAAMSGSQARAMIGKTVVIAEDRFVIGNRICKRPSYERSVDDLAKSFREEGHVSSVNMGLPDPVTSIDAHCTQIYLKAPDHIVVHWDGFYFDAVRSGR